MLVSDLFILSLIKRLCNIFYMKALYIVNHIITLINTIAETLPDNLRNLATCPRDSSFRFNKNS